MLPVLPVGLWKISLFAKKLIFSFGNRSAEVESNFREMAATYAGFPGLDASGGCNKGLGFWVFVTLRLGFRFSVKGFGMFNMGLW